MVVAWLLNYLIAYRGDWWFVWLSGCLVGFVELPLTMMGGDCGDCDGVGNCGDCDCGGDGG